ncbi:MAG: hypothetical protein IKH99_06835 [Prevotella sp.]|nr:hypothetical protein [Prevotella sp.]
MQLTIGAPCVVVGSGKEVFVTIMFVVVNEGEDMLGIRLQFISLVGCLDGKQFVVHAVGLTCRRHCVLHQFEDPQGTVGIDSTQAVGYHQLRGVAVTGAGQEGEHQQEGEAHRLSHRSVFRLQRYD